MGLSRGKQSRIGAMDWALRELKPGEQKQMIWKLQSRKPKWGFWDTSNTRGQEVLTFSELSMADIWVSLQQQPTDVLGHNPPSTPKTSSDLHECDSPSFCYKLHILILNT